MSLLAAFIGDAHLLEKSFSGREMFGDPFFAFDQVVDDVIATRETEPDLRYLISAGDLADSQRPSSAVIDFLRSRCERLEQFGIRFVFITGNHDACPTPWPTAVFPRAIHLSGKSLQIGKLKVYGLDYHVEDTFRAKLKRLPPKVDVLVCHQAWREFSSRGILSLEEVPRKCTVFSGDTHRYEEVEVGDKLGISPGALYMCQSREPFEHGFHYMDQDGVFLRQPLKSRPGLRRFLETEDQATAFLDNLPQTLTQLEQSGGELPDEIRRPMLVLRLAPETQKFAQRLTAALRGRAHLFWSKAAEDDYCLPSTSAAAVEESGAGDFLALAAETLGDDPEALAILRALWSARDPRTELARLRKERLGDPASS